MSLQQLKAHALQNEDVLNEYNALEDEFNLINQLFTSLSPHPANHYALNA
ncbi:MAG: hypothetical protein V7784_07660 [Oceanospirillaceae bacterium]